MPDQTDPEIKSLIEQIRRTPLHSLDPEGWDALHEKLLALLGTEEPEAVGYALNRLAAAFWAERSDARRNPEMTFRSTAGRLAAVLQALERRADLIECLNDFVSYARGLADEESYRWVFLGWLAAYTPKPEDAKAWQDAALAHRVSLRGFGEDWATASGRLIALLDHPSLQVRACAAHELGDLHAEGERDNSDLTELMEVIRKADIGRPGVAGPFYGAIQFHLESLPGDGLAQARRWMLSILEHRKTPEPDLLKYHFNGIDFHAHEVLAGHPRDILKLIDIGEPEIAIMAATEDGGVVEGLQDLLIQLGNSDEDEICRLAAWHLAYHYRLLHERGAARGFVTRWVMTDGTEIFFNSQSEHQRYPYAATIYPPREREFTSVEAWGWVHRLLPDDMRGEPLPYAGELLAETLADGGMVVGDSVNYRLSCGALVALKGEAASEPWRRVQIIWHGPEKTWAPGDYLSDNA